MINKVDIKLIGKSEDEWIELGIAIENSKLLQFSSTTEKAKFEICISNNQSVSDEAIRGAVISGILYALQKLSIDISATHFNIILLYVKGCLPLEDITSCSIASMVAVSYALCNGQVIKNEEISPWSIKEVHIYHSSN